jgi:hypothetical protein
VVVYICTQKSASLLREIPLSVHKRTVKYPSSVLIRSKQKQNVELGRPRKSIGYTFQELVKMISMIDSCHHQWGSHLAIELSSTSEWGCPLWARAARPNVCQKLYFKDTAAGLFFYPINVCFGPLLRHSPAVLLQRTSVRISPFFGDSLNRPQINHFSVQPN